MGFGAKEVWSLNLKELKGFELEQCVLGWVRTIISALNRGGDAEVGGGEGDGLGGNVERAGESDAVDVGGERNGHG